MIENIQELTGEITPTQELTGEIDYRVVGGGVDDVLVNGTSVVENKIASIDLTGKQDALTAGQNITIENNVISSTASGGQIIQYDTIPVASGDNLGNIIQYVGESTNNYINGYFYKCVSDGAVEPTYSWETIDVEKDKNIKLALWDYPDGSSKRITGVEAMKDLQKAIDLYVNQTKIYKLFTNNCWLTEVNLLNARQDYKRYELVFFGIIKYSGNINICRRTMAVYTDPNSTTIFDYNSASYYPRTLEDQKIIMVSTEILEPYLRRDNTTAFTPTGNYNPATKKYVDDKIGDINTILASLTTPSNGGN